MARMIRMFLIICCMIVRTLQSESEGNGYKTLHVYDEPNDSMRKPAIFAANSHENIVNKRRKRDSNAPSDKVENHKNITTAVSEMFLFIIFIYFDLDETVQRISFFLLELFIYFSI